MIALRDNPRKCGHKGGDTFGQSAIAMLGEKATPEQIRVWKSVGILNPTANLQSQKKGRKTK